MAKYEVGSWVRVKSANEIAETLDCNGETDGVCLIAKMLKFCGALARVERMDLNGDYHLKGVGYWYWPEAWLSPAFRPGDRVRIKSIIEIKATLGVNRFHAATGLRFAAFMEKYSGDIVTITCMTGAGNFKVKGNDWMWSPDWLELVEAAPEAESTAATTETLKTAPDAGWDAFAATHSAAVAFLKAISFDEDGGFKVDAEVTSKSRETEVTKERWKPKGGEIYWLVGASTTVINDVWSGASTDERRWIVGNCFATEEEVVKAAEEVRKALKALHAGATN